MSVLDRLKKNAKQPTKKVVEALPPGAERINEDTWLLHPKLEIAPYKADGILVGQRKAGKKNTLAYLVHHLSAEGAELIIHAFKVLRGEQTTTMWMPAEGGPVEVERKPTIEEQQKARDYLTNRGWGKEAQIIELNVNEKEDAFDLSLLSTEELVQYRTLQRKMRRGATPVEGASTKHEDAELVDAGT